MKKFLYRFLFFVAIIVLILIGSLLFFPNQTAKKGMMGELLDKHKLLENTSSPRIVLVGGSNVSFGIDSKRIIDSLHINVVNTGLHAGIGLKFMLNDMKSFVKKNDIIVVSPEYSNFYNSDVFLGNIELVSILFDVYPKGRSLINLNQWVRLMDIIPQYAVKKMTSFSKVSDVVYSRKSFNKYGDASAHWTLPSRKFVTPITNSAKETINEPTITELLAFSDYVKSKGAKLVILPPVLQRKSYENEKIIIDKISQSLDKVHLPFFAPTERYEFNDDLFFNSEYHCNKAGVDKRTELIIEDLKKYMQTQTN